MSSDPGRRAGADTVAAHQRAHEGTATPPHVIDSHLGEQSAPTPVQSHGAQPPNFRALVQQAAASHASSPLEVRQAPLTPASILPGVDAHSHPAVAPMSDPNHFHAAISAVESRHALALAASDARASAAQVAAAAAAREIAEARREASAARIEADAARSHATTASTRAEAALQEIRAARLIAVEKEAAEVNTRAEKIAAERVKEANERAAKEAERAKEAADHAAIVAAAASAAAAHRDAPPLPPGWVARTSRRTGATYYVHESGDHSVDHPSLVIPSTPVDRFTEAVYDEHRSVVTGNDEHGAAAADFHAEGAEHTEVDSDRGSHDGGDGFESDNTEDLLHRAANLLNSHTAETRTVRFHLPVASAPRRDADGSVWVEKMSSKGKHYWVNVSTGESRW